MTYINTPSIPSYAGPRGESVYSRLSKQQQQGQANTRMQTEKMNQEKKVTFVFSTHDKMVMDYARRLVSIRDGRLADDQMKSA